LAFDINSFKQFGLPFGGARPSLFEVWMTPPSASANQDKIRFQCMAAQLPAATVGSIDVPYFGRKIKVAGDRTFADWQVNILNDEDFPIRAIMESWSNDINTLASNVRLGANIEDYKSTDAFVTQYSKKGEGFPLRRYKFVGIYPNNIEAINLDWDRTNSIETFAVTFSYDYWEIDSQEGTLDIVDAQATN